ncbi:MAG TPA: lipopolysaccharide heptosyltransferase II [Candidatus Acidoferrales bacterium]|nr:lipopolysaccharide heptosyltransferase II [Candidatus Acidoferrales bacterium]
MKVLVRATNWVGDAIMSLPAQGALRARNPEAQITILARPWVADMYRDQACADEIIAYDSKGEHSGFWGRERLARELRERKFDVAVLFQNAFDAAWIAWRAGIPRRIGYARDLRGPLLTQSIRVPRAGEIPAHESYYYLELLRRAGLIESYDAVEEIRLHVGADAKDRALQTLRDAGIDPNRVRVAIAPGAAYGAAKCWMPERYAALADRLIDEFGAAVIIFGAAAEDEVARRISAAMRHKPISLVGQTSIGELPALLSACQLFIGNDSGAMHVAGAVGLPVVGIFGSSDPEGTAPVTPGFRLVRHAVDCSPCFLRRCPIDHRCMTRIEVGDVYAAAKEFARQVSSAAIPARSEAVR